MYKCTYKKCRYVAGTVCDLTRHTRTHTGERPYYCPHCGKPFVETGNLFKHIRNVHKENPFKCLHCEMTFARKADLRHHRELHTSDGKYCCLRCCMRFANARDLHKHHATHTAHPFSKSNVNFETQPCTTEDVLKYTLKDVVYKKGGGKNGEPFTVKGGFRNCDEDANDILKIKDMDSSPSASVKLKTDDETEKKIDINALKFKTVLCARPEINPSDSVSVPVNKSSGTALSKNGEVIFHFQILDETPDTTNRDVNNLADTKPDTTNPDAVKLGATNPEATKTDSTQVFTEPPDLTETLSNSNLLTNSFAKSNDFTLHSLIQDLEERLKENPYFKSYQCSLCNYTTSEEKVFQHHEAICREQKSLPFLLCRHCGYASSNTSKFREHKNSHKIKKLDDSVEGFILPKKIDRTDKIHFPCFICIEKLPTDLEEKALKTPIPCSNFRKELKKRKLNEAFVIRYREIRNESKMNHRLKNIYRCKFCCFNTTTMYNLSGHLKRHTGEKQFPCCECPRSFEDRNLLIRHRAMHQDLFKCLKCNASFILRRTLNRHLHFRLDHARTHFVEARTKQKLRRTLENTPSTQDEDMTSIQDHDAPSTKDQDAPNTQDQDMTSTKDENARSTRDEFALTIKDKNEDAPSTMDKDAASILDKVASRTQDTKLKVPDFVQVAVFKFNDGLKAPIKYIKKEAEDENIVVESKPYYDKFRNSKLTSTFLDITRSRNFFDSEENSVNGSTSQKPVTEISYAKTNESNTSAINHKAKPRMVNKEVQTCMGNNEDVANSVKNKDAVNIEDKAKSINDEDKANSINTNNRASSVNNEGKVFPENDGKLVVANKVKSPQNFVNEIQKLQIPKTLPRAKMNSILKPYAVQRSQISTKANETNRVFANSGTSYLYNSKPIQFFNIFPKPCLLSSDVSPKNIKSSQPQNKSGTFIQFYPKPDQPNIIVAKPTLQRPVYVPKPTQPANIVKNLIIPTIPVVKTTQPANIVKKLIVPTIPVVKTNQPLILVAKPTEESISVAKPTLPPIPVAEATQSPIPDAKPTQPPTPVAEATQSPIPNAKPTQPPISVAKPTQPSCRYTISKPVQSSPRKPYQLLIRLNQSTKYRLLNDTNGNSKDLKALRPGNGNSPIKVARCSSCNNSRPNILRHPKKTGDETSFLCLNCGHSFSLHLNLNTIIKRNHSTDFNINETPPKVAKTSN